MSRSKRIGIDRQGVCSLDAPLLVRGDVVSVELSDGRSVEFPENWGLVHDTSGSCSHQCEIFVCPYSVQRQFRGKVETDIHETALSYWGDDYRLYEGQVVLPEGPWQRVGQIVRVYYDRYGELASKYQHPFETKVKDAAILYKQSRAQRYGSSSHRAYRISLPDGCVINAHGFVWP